jgi:ribonuclease MRP protein subunit RMP1
VLGLVLMASVARVCRITGITTAYEESASDDVKGVMTAIDDGRVAVEFGGLLEEEDFAWDEGEVVEREE